MDDLVFSIQTIPDIDGARRLYDLHGLADEDVAKALLHKRRQQAKTETLPHHLQKIVAISAVLSRSGQFKVWSLGDDTSSEQDLLQRFYDGLTRYRPRLVSWNGRGLDLPVIHYRSLLYPLNAQCYWTIAEHDAPLQGSNNLSRFLDRHVDLQEVLAVFQQQAAVLEDELARLCGFPGVGGGINFNRWQHSLNREVTTIRRYGERRVLNTYLLFLNWERNRGQLSQEQYEQQCSLVRDELKMSGQTHLADFEKNWIAV